MSFGKKELGSVNPHDIENSIKMDAEKAFRLWEHEKSGESKLRWMEAESKREDFVSKYSCDRIEELTIDEYCGNMDSFCRIMRYDLNCMASMGNAYPATFGIYIKKDTNQICLSKTYSNMFGDDTQAAFEYIKKEIVMCINGFKTERYKILSRIKLNSMFAYKILLVYYPDDVYPVCSKGTLKKYCDYLGLQYTEKEEMYVGIQRILEWKKKSSILRDINNAYLMYFAGWLITSDISINGHELEDCDGVVDINKELPPAKIIDDNGSIKYVCGNCSFEFVRAKRCPECGQLVRE